MHGQRSARILDGIAYEEGAVFRVLRPCQLTGLAPEPGHGWLQGWKQDLKPGDMVTCTGFGPGWGSDPGFGIEFITDQAREAGAIHCDIEPHVGGMWAYRPAPGLLERA